VEYNACIRTVCELRDRYRISPRRADIRRFSQFSSIVFRREGKILQWHGRVLFTINNWDHSGTRLDWFGNVNYRFILSGRRASERSQILDMNGFAPWTTVHSEPQQRLRSRTSRGYFRIRYFKPVSISRSRLGNGHELFSGVWATGARQIELCANLCHVRPGARLTIDNSIC